MRRPTRPLLLISAALSLTLAGVAFAAPQDEEPSKPAAPAESTQPSPEEQAAAKLKELNAQYGRERGAYYKAARAQREAQKNDPTAAVEPLVKPEPAHIDRLFAAAEEFAGTEHAVGFLTGAFGTAARGGDARAHDALKTMLDHHIENKALDRVTFSLIYYGRNLGDEVVQSTIDRLVEASPHASVKAAMLYARGSLINRNRAATEEERQAALPPLEEAVRLSPDSRFGQLAKSTIFELTKLQVGLPAPDIEGKDLDGVAFKLSDYKGKVVLLDFWGDW